MKKFTTLLIVTFTLTAMLPAADFAITTGAGAHIGGLFTRYKLTADGKIEGEPVNVSAAQEMNQINFGGFLFVDGTWAVFSLGIQGGLNNYNETMVAEIPSSDNLVIPSTGKGSEVMLNFTLLGKYPFPLKGNERITLFPMAGLEYQIALMEARQPEGRQRYDRTDKRKGENDVNGSTYTLPAWNSLFVIIGGGMDYRLTSSLYLRPELLYSFRLQTPYEVDALEKAKKALNAPNPKLGGLTSGPTLRIAAGWRF
jgi:hypothetical protein